MAPVRSVCRVPLFPLSRDDVVAIVFGTAIGVATVIGGCSARGCVTESMEAEQRPSGALVSPGLSPGAGSLPAGGESVPGDREDVGGRMLGR